MIVKNVVSIALATSIAVATPALAQDNDVGDWNGAYIGGSLGLTWQPNFDRETQESLTFDTNGDGTYGDPVTTAAGGNAFAPGFCRGRAHGSTPADGCTVDKDKRVGWSAHFGYDRQFGNIVVGGVVEAGRTMIGNSVSGFSTTPASYMLSRRIDFDASARLRAGIALPTNTLLYGTGGLAYGRLDNSFLTTNTFNNFSQTNQSQDEWGWTAGGGVEQKVSRNFSIGVLYRYTRFSTDGYTVNAGNGTPVSTTNPFVITPAGSTDIRRSNDIFDSHAIRATASFRF